MLIMKQKYIGVLKINTANSRHGASLQISLRKNENMKENNFNFVVTIYLKMGRSPGGKPLGTSSKKNLRTTIFQLTINIPKNGVRI